jgi:hypothetical protein
MVFDSPTAVQQLQTLERQLAEAPRHDAAVRVPWRGDRQAARRAIAQAERHVRAMAITTEDLKVHVVCADGLGALVADAPARKDRATERAS